MKRYLAFNNRSGQILLIALMLIAAVIVVSFTASFLSRSNTQTTKLLEENQKALAAAEAGIQAALKAGQSINSIGTLNGLNNYSGSATLTALSASPTFSTSVIQANDQYTFYLATYDPATKTFTGTSTGSPDITICYGNKSSTTAPALEITILRSGTSNMTRYVIDTSSRITNASSGSLSCAPNTATFNYSTTITSAAIGANAQLMLVRVLYQASSLYFAATPNTTNLPIQGTSVDSTATSSQTGVTKKLRVFQSYPQIPADMFNIRF